MFLKSNRIRITQYFPLVSKNRVETCGIPLKHADSFAEDGVSGNDTCCVCGGGYDLQSVIFIVPNSNFWTVENNDLYNRIADLTESLKSKDYFESPDYQYLIEENRKLEEERNELLTDNKKLAAQVEDKINQLRKSGMI